MKLKTGLYAITLVLIAGMLFFSCKKDKTEDTKKNQVTYNGTGHPLDKGVIVHWQFKAEGHATTLVFVSPEGTFHTTGTSFDSITGTNGTGLAIALYSSDSVNLAEGTYTYDTTGNNTAGTFVRASMVLNYNFGTDDGTEVLGFGGAVTVKKVGTDYEITYSGADETGKVIELYYKGILKDYINISKKAKTWGL
ncbi:MAG: hypothetical protein WCO63_03340 [Bacteroidota bacterium]